MKAFFTKTTAKPSTWHNVSPACKPQIHTININYVDKALDCTPRGDDGTFKALTDKLTHKLKLPLDLLNNNNKKERLISCLIALLKIQHGSAGSALLQNWKCLQHPWPFSLLCWGKKCARLEGINTHSWGKGWGKKSPKVPHRHGKARQEMSLYHRGSQGDSCCYFIVGCPLRGHGCWVEVKHFYHVFPEHAKERSVPAQNHGSRPQRVKSQILYSSGHYKPEIMVSNLHVLPVALYFKMIPFLNKLLPISGFFFHYFNSQELPGHKQLNTIF